MLSLSDREWKEFYIRDIFVVEDKNEIQVPTGAYINKKYLTKGETPRITVTSQNNGIGGYYDSQDKNYRTFNNFISVSFLGTIFYQPYTASLDMKVHCLQIIDKKLNCFISKFLITEIKKSIENVSYGDQLSSTDLPNKKIMLPINSQGQLDYDFMESYVSEREGTKRQEYLAYAKKSIAELEYKEIPELYEMEWKEVYISDLCVIESGKDIYDAERASGKTPYITSTATNNGINYFVSNENETLEENVISVNRNGSVGYCFYHKYKALYSNDCRKLRLKQKRNEFVSLFITNQIAQQKEKYNYGYKMGTGRLKKQKILVPINEQKQPDFEYMEQYIKNMIIQKYNSYFDIGINYS